MSNEPANFHSDGKSVDAVVGRPWHELSLDLEHAYQLSLARVVQYLPTRLNLELAGIHDAVSPTSLDSFPLGSAFPTNTGVHALARLIDEQVQSPLGLRQLSLALVILVRAVDRSGMDCAALSTRVVCVDTSVARQLSELVVGLRLGMVLGFTVAQLYELASVLLLRDIGMVGQAHWGFRSRNGGMNRHAYWRVQQHPVIGYALLAREKGLFSAGVLHGVLNHHERLDGSGYPRRLRGERINQYGRIAAVLDTYFLQRRNGRNVDDAIWVLRSIAGVRGPESSAGDTALDEEVIDALSGMRNELLAMNRVRRHKAQYPTDAMELFEYSQCLHERDMDQLHKDLRSVTGLCDRGSGMQLWRAAQLLEDVHLAHYAGNYSDGANPPHHDAGYSLLESVQRVAELLRSVSAQLPADRRGELLARVDTLLPRLRRIDRLLPSDSRLLSSLRKPKCR